MYRKKTNIDLKDLKIGQDGGTITITAGDSEFQKTLSEKEKEYIKEGGNWIGMFGREIELKILHLIGYTLDQIIELPEKEREEIWNRAHEEWNKKDTLR